MKLKTTRNAVPAQRSKPNVGAQRQLAMHLTLLRELPREVRESERDRESEQRGKEVWSHQRGGAVDRQSTTVRCSNGKEW